MNKKLLKSIGAILAGFITVFVLSIVTDIILETTGIFPPQNKVQLYTGGMFLFALIYRLVYTAIGGYITAALASNQPMRHVIILAAIGFVVSILGTIAMWDKSQSAPWYPIALVILSPVSLYLGGKIRVKRVEKGH